MRKLALFYAVVGLGTAAACAQQAPMADMPGMHADHATPQQRAAPRTPPNRKPNLADPTAPDMQGMGHDHGNARAQGAAASMEHSEAQQAGQGTGKPGASSDQTSISLPLQDVQELEAAAFRTGQDLPAPELLLDVVARTPMSLEAFVHQAETTNPTLAQARANVLRSEQQARQAGLPPDPVLGYSGEHIRGGSYHGGEEGAFVSQEFVLGRKLALRRDVFKAEARTNERALEVQAARVRNDVESAFIDALTAQQTVVLDDRLLKVALDADTNAHELQRVGQADATDVLKAEIAAEQAKVDFSHAQRMFLSAFARLATAVGSASMLPHPLQGELAQPPLLEAEALAVADAQQSPAVEQARANVSLAEARVRSAQREKVPNLDVRAGEWYSGEQLDGITRRAGWMSFAEAGVQIPIWNRNQGNTGAAKALLERARQDVSRVQLLTLHNAQPLAQAYLAARYASEKLRVEMLPRAHRIYQLEAMKYQQMAQSYPHVLAAQRMLFTLQKSYVTALQEEWHAAIGLRNFTLTGGLDAPMSAGSDDTMMNVPAQGGR